MKITVTETKPVTSVVEVPQTGFAVLFEGVVHALFTAPRPTCSTSVSTAQREAKEYVEGKGGNTTGASRYQILPYTSEAPFKTMGPG